MYVIQQRFKEWEKWETVSSKGRFETLPEAKAAFEKMSNFEKKICRIAEEYTITRYKAV